VILVATITTYGCAPTRIGALTTAIAAADVDEADPGVSLCLPGGCRPMAERADAADTADLLRLIFKENTGRKLPLCIPADPASPTCRRDGLGGFGARAMAVEVLETRPARAHRGEGDGLRVRVRIVAALFGQPMTCAPVDTRLWVAESGPIRWHLPASDCTWMTAHHRSADWTIALHRLDLARGLIAGGYRTGATVPSGGETAGTLKLTFQRADAIQETWEARRLAALEPARPADVRSGTAVFRPGPARLAPARRALVIGNGAYRTATLPNPVNDARDMADGLEAVGFSVMRLEDVERAAMLAAIRAFATIPDRAVLVFFFAGHGIRAGEINYLLPVDAEPRRAEDLPNQGVAVDHILAQLRRAEPELTLVILDACQNNPFLDEAAARPRSWTAPVRTALLDAIRGTDDTLIAYATAPGTTALDGHGRNGVFTRHLLHHLGRPHQTMALYFRRVTRSVIAETDGRQRPWVSGGRRATEFAFVPSEPGQVPLQTRQ